jgi:hypothetical protein
MLWSRISSPLTSLKVENSGWSSHLRSSHYLSSDRMQMHCSNAWFNPKQCHIQGVSSRRRHNFVDLDAHWRRWVSPMMTRFFIHPWIHTPSTRMDALWHPAWGAFNPYPVRVDVTKVGRTLVILPPFSSLASVGYYAGLFGSMTLVKCLTSGGMALSRNRRDVWNDLFGVAAVYGWARFLFVSEKRVCWNNRAFAGIAISSVVYANTAPW